MSNLKIGAVVRVVYDQNFYIIEEIKENSVKLNTAKRSPTNSNLFIAGIEKFSEPLQNIVVDEDDGA